MYAKQILIFLAQEPPKYVCCLHEEALFAFVPYGHKCCCGECARRCSEGAGWCPTCRTRAISILRIYSKLFHFCKNKDNINGIFLFYL